MKHLGQTGSPPWGSHRVYCQGVPLLNFGSRPPGLLMPQRSSAALKKFTPFSLRTSHSLRVLNLLSGQGRKLPDLIAPKPAEKIFPLGVSLFGHRMRASSLAFPLGLEGIESSIPLGLNRIKAQKKVKGQLVLTAHSFDKEDIFLSH